MSDISEAAHDPADGIGSRVAAFRGSRAMKVAELAREAGVTSSLISQIERGQSRPSVSTLFAIAQALAVPVDALFRESPGVIADAGTVSGSAAVPAPRLPEAADRPRAERESSYVVRRGERAAIDVEGGVRWERLTPRTPSHMDFFQLVYGPHAESHPAAYTHPGTEVILITEGMLDIFLGFDRYRLHPGDSMQMPCAIPHRYVNPGAETARAVSVILHDCPSAEGDPVRLPLPAGRYDEDFYGNSRNNLQH